MPRRARDARLSAALERVLDGGETITGRGVCWAAPMRPRVPRWLLGRHQYDVVLTDRRVLLFARRRRRLRPDDVAMAKRFSSLALESNRWRVPLLQQCVRLDTGRRLVIEWRPRHRHLGRALAAALERA